MVDALNAWVETNQNDDLLNWTQDDIINDGYPTIVTDNGDVDVDQLVA